MPEIIGVQFQNAGKIYYFDSCGQQIDTNEHVIVETARGVEYARVSLATHWLPEEDITEPLKPIIRVADEEDRAIYEENLEAAKEAYAICQEKIIYCGLEMKLVNVEYTFDRAKVIFNFTADERVDFRELIKELAAVFHTRIELRQIGVRDEAKIIGGIGICGEPLCCHRFLTDFSPVSIKMAKEQNLSLNPTKISGVCGRLMCCLKHEQETYEELNSRLPGNGDAVTTPDGLKGEVQSVNVLRQKVKVIVTLDGDEKEIREYPVEELKFRPRKKKEKGGVSDKELKKLEALEKQERKSKLDED